MKIALRAGREKRLRDIGAVLERLRALPLDSQFEAYIRPWRPPEDNQRNYYWVCLRYLEDNLKDDIEVGGWTAMDWHEFFKREFGVETTKELDRAEWSDYLDKVHRFAAQWIALPEPQ